MQEQEFDVIVVGAGPSGAAASTWLARNGLRVLLVDKAGRGRDKTCGDALIPDAFDALEHLGCLDEISAVAHHVSHLRIYAPDRTTVDVPGRLACVPRQVFDALLVKHALPYGVDYRPETSFGGFLEQFGRISGVKLIDRRDHEYSIHARHVLLATGAASEPLLESGLCTRKSPSGLALRAYFRLPQSLADEMNHFAISFDQRICPGYGWIFAGPDNVFNVGVGFFYDSLRKPPTENLRHLWSWFLESFEPAIQVKKHGKQVSREKGAPLRTGLSGAKSSRAGLMLIGEALGTTYSFSGEGIGKAMQTGIMAAKCIVERPEAPEQEYDYRIAHELRRQYAAYKTAQDWLSFPPVCNLLARRANQGKFVRRQLESLLAETSDPRHLFSFGGIVKALFT